MIKIEILEEIYYIDADFYKQEVYLYKVNHNIFGMIKYIFSNCSELAKYVIRNSIQSVIFCGVGYLRPLKIELENHYIVCNIDYYIHLESYHNHYKIKERKVNGK